MNKEILENVLKIAQKEKQEQYAKKTKIDRNIYINSNGYFYGNVFQIKEENKEQEPLVINCNKTTELKDIVKDINLNMIDNLAQKDVLKDNLDEGAKAPQTPIVSIDVDMLLNILTKMIITTDKNSRQCVGDIVLYCSHTTLRLVVLSNYAAIQSDPIIISTINLTENSLGVIQKSRKDILIALLKKYRQTVKKVQILFSKKGTFVVCDKFIFNADNNLVNLQKETLVGWKTLSTGFFERTSGIAKFKVTKDIINVFDYFKNATQINLASNTLTLQKEDKKIIAPIEIPKTPTSEQYIVNITNMAKVLKANKNENCQLRIKTSNTGITILYLIINDMQYLFMCQKAKEQN